MKLENAIEKKIINNEILAYFMGRAYLFLLNIGIDRNKIRFRQHKKDEMAHYAKDCWDIELHSSQGWIECVGIADRSAFDLTCHGKAANIDLSYSEKLDDPIVIKEWRPIIEKKNFIKHLKNNFDAFEKEIKSLKNSELLEMMITEESENFINYKYKNEIYKVPCEFVEFKIFEKKLYPMLLSHHSE
ncbi:glycyl-trna synthetase [Vairimorpha apis BRL 01]|uniref:Glycyl-trna synthetase n=1 Tax=Vairimorpha apis BRL 01 TaxID=1037528 RepID=T0KZQ6_9MICR|nr:glycyl-trna synthetase [Vairimorpha apis BRL 01]